MKIDLYTKCILTVIAACLLWSNAQPFIQPRPVAASDTVRVYVEGISSSASLDVDVEHISSLATLKVNVDEPLDVNIDGVSSLISSSLPVRVR